MREANNNYKEAMKYFKSSCFKCRFKPDYMSAIPYFKLAADGYHGCKNFEKEIETRKQLVKCFENERSNWEEANEYEKMSKVQLNQLKSPSDAYNSLEKAFHSYVNDNKYSYAIKALHKSSDNFIESGNKTEAEKVLAFAFEGINKYYHVITLDKSDSHEYIYDCIDKYIDLLFSENDYKKAAEVSKKTTKLIEKDNEKEKEMISKYYAIEAIAELLDKQEDKYNKSIEKGMKVKEGQNGICNKLYKLINLIKENNKDNEKMITSLYQDISYTLPHSVSKMLYKYIEDHKISDDNNYINNDTNNENDKDKSTEFEKSLQDYL